LNHVSELGIVNKMFQGRDEMIQPTSVFLKTQPRLQNRSQNYQYLIKILDAFFMRVKVDASLPQESMREEFNLYLIDSTDAHWKDLLPAELVQLAKQHLVVIFNADTNAICEKNLLLNGIKGVFFADQSPEDIFAGLVRVINGELFFSRKSISTTFNHMLSAMSRSQFNASNDSVNTGIDLSLLTKREKSVIHLLAQGASNRDIAERLNISDHTVKTHLYSAFKKTASRNRVELANWAQNYMAVSLSLQNTQ